VKKMLPEYVWQAFQEGRGEPYRAAIRAGIDAHQKKMREYEKMSQEKISQDLPKHWVNAEGPSPEAAPVNWENFKEGEGEYFMPETGKKHRLGFASLREDKAEVDEQLDDGQVRKKTVPCLIMRVDLLDGKKTDKKFSVTSKRLAAQIKAYFEEKLLFSRVFSLEKTGEKFQTKYVLMALGDKPKT